MKKNGGSLKIHKQDGTIQEERTYPKSDDPRNTLGQEIESKNNTSYNNKTYEWCAFCL